MHTWNTHTQQLTESPHWFPDLWVITRKIVNQKSWRIPRGIAEVIFPIKDLKDAEMVIPTTSPSNSPWACAADRWILEYDSGFL